MEEQYETEEYRINKVNKTDTTVVDSRMTKKVMAMDHSKNAKCVAKTEDI